MKNKSPISLAVILCLLSSSVVQAATPPVGTEWVKSVGASGSITWTAPSSLSSGQAIWAAGTSTGALATVSQAIPIGAQTIPVVAKSVVTAASAVALMRTLTGGPLGLAIFAAPTVLEWINSSNTRMSASPTVAQPFEVLKTSSVPPPEAIFYPSDISGCNNQNISTTTAGYVSPCEVFQTARTDCQYATPTDYCYGIRKSTNYVWIYRLSKTAPNTAWYPASMDDISPYMSPRPVLPGALNTLLNFDKTQSLPVTPQTLTGPATLAAPAYPPVVETVPASPPVSNTSKVSGNPSNLPASTPTVTNSSTGSNPVTTPSGKSVSQPTTTSTTSTYDAGTNVTTNTTSTTAAPITATTTTNSVTNNTYTTNSVTSTGTTTTSTSVVNNITNQAVGSPITSTQPYVPVEPTKVADVPDLCVLHPEVIACVTPDKIDQCKLHPESLGCKEFDTPTVPELETKDVSISITKEPGFGPSTGSCPAPRYLKAGKAEFSFQPFCDYSSALRPVLIAVAWLSAAMLLIGASRKE